MLKIHLMMLRIENAELSPQPIHDLFVSLTLMFCTFLTGSD